MKALSESKSVRGFTEGSFVVALADLATDAIVTAVPWFEPRRVTLLIVVGAVVGALVRKLLARFLWRSSRG